MALTKVSPAVLDLEGYNEVSDLEAAVTAAGATETTLMVVDTQTLTDDLTIPANIDLDIPRSGSISIATGKTLTVNGSIRAGLYQIFSGDGVVEFGESAVSQIPFFHPVWWDEDCCDGSDKYTVLQKVIVALPNDKEIYCNGIILVPPRMAWNKETTNINPLYENDGYNQVIIDNSGMLAGGYSGTMQIFTYGWRETPSLARLNEIVHASPNHPTIVLDCLTPETQTYGSLVFRQKRRDGWIFGQQQGSSGQTITLRSYLEQEQMYVENESGTFEAWETITGAVSGETATFIKHEEDFSLNWFEIIDASGAFTAGEEVEGDSSGATADVYEDAIDCGVQVVKWPGRGGMTFVTADPRFTGGGGGLYMATPGDHGGVAILNITSRGEVTIKNDDAEVVMSCDGDNMFASVGNGWGFAEYDFSVDGGAISTITLAEDVVPDNSVIVEAHYEVLTTLTSATDAATVCLSTNQVTNEIVTATAIDAGTNSWDAGYHDCIPDGAAANFTTKTTASRDIVMAIAVEAVTAGKLRLWYKFVTSE